MKKIISNELLKNIGYILGYWAVCVIFPFIIAWYMNIYIIHHPSSAQVLGYTPFYILFYVLFIAPLLYFIPYLLIKPKTPLSKFLYIFLGVILPYVLIYIYINTNFHMISLG